jgi:hypothetical protein
MIFSRYREKVIFHLYLKFLYIVELNFIARLATYWGNPGGILEMGEVKILKRQSRIWNYSEYIQVKMDLLNIQMEIRFLVSK